jgi:hypothetical protein
LSSHLWSSHDTSFLMQSIRGIWSSIYSRSYLCMSYLSIHDRHRNERDGHATYRCPSWGRGQQDLARRGHKATSLLPCCCPYATRLLCTYIHEDSNRCKVC